MDVRCVEKRKNRYETVQRREEEEEDEDEDEEDERRCLE